MAAKDNTLVEGETRVGWYFDERPETPDTVVALERVRNRPQLTVPILTRSGAPKHPLFEFFEHDVWEGDAGKSSPRRPPSELLFQDSRGYVALVGCEGSRGTVSTSGHRTSHGRVTAEYGVLGASHARFSKVNRVRVLSPAISQWIGLSSVEVSDEVSEDNLLHAVQIRYVSQSATKVARSLNLEFKPSWMTNIDHATGQSTGRAYSLVQTQVARPRPWKERLVPLRAIVDLVNIASWEDHPIERLEVQRHDDPIRVLSGKPVGGQWLDTIQSDLEVGAEPSKRYRFLFKFGDLHSEAIGRWLRLQKRFPRALNPLGALPRMTDTYIDNQLLQSSIAVDTLGNGINADEGPRNHTARSHLSYNDALRAVADSMAWHPIPSIEDWIQSSNSAYMAAKHVNRPKVSGRDMYDAHIANAMMLRAWVAQQLGVTESKFRANLFTDPIGWTFSDTT